MPPQSSTSLPTALARRLAEQFGDVAMREIAKAMGPRKTTLRVNLLKSSDQEVMNTLRESGIKFQRVLGVPNAFVIENRGDSEMLAHPLTTDGKIYLQGAASMLPPLLLAPQPGEIVLDACAAPGSKTSQLAMLMQNEGRIVAIEENQVRLGKLRHTLNLQGATVAESVQGDSRKLHKAFPPNTFDAILADVPCSAEGRIDLNDRRSFGFWSEKNIREHAKLQQQILNGIIPLLKPGGRLVYSTCTLAPEENEQNAAWILQNFPHLKEEPIKLPLQGARTRKHGVTILPTTLTEGFYVASFRAKKEIHINLAIWMNRLILLKIATTIFHHFRHIGSKSGETFPTVEHAYQAAKIIPGPERESIKNAPSPLDAWREGQKHKNNPKITIPNFSKDEIMEELFRAKMAQHPDIIVILRESGNRELLKTIATDYYWGTGHDGSGENKMGKLWMKLRDELI